MRERTVSLEELENFFAFLQCQLRKQASVRLDAEVKLSCTLAKEMWSQFEEWVQPNLGKKDKWVPFHTVLCSHELFAVQHIHACDADWDDRQKLIALFIFRTHCRSEVFNTVQLPHLKKKDFWNDPYAPFSEEGAITKAMLAFRRAGNPMQTMAFRCIPARLRADDAENLVLNIANRTRILIEVAENIWLIVNDSSTSTATKFEQMSIEIRRGKGLGDTWVKMLMVSVDIFFPRLGLLAERCDVGIGAVRGLERLVPGAGCLEGDQVKSQSALELVTAAMNSEPPRVPSASAFWSLLPEVERMACDKYGANKLLLSQMSTQKFALSAGTVQVQLCEWRQYHDWRIKKTKLAMGELDDSQLQEEEDDDDLPLVAAPKAGFVREGPAPNSALKRLRRSREDCSSSPSRDTFGGLATATAVQLDWAGLADKTVEVARKRVEDMREAEEKACELCEAQETAAQKLLVAKVSLHEADQEHKRLMREEDDAELKAVCAEAKFEAIEEELDEVEAWVEGLRGRHFRELFSEFEEFMSFGDMLEQVLATISSSGCRDQSGLLIEGTDGLESSVDHALEAEITKCRLNLEELERRQAEALQELGRLRTKAQESSRIKLTKAEEHEVAKVAFAVALTSHKEQLVVLRSMKMAVAHANVANIAAEAVKRRREADSQREGGSG